MRLMAALRFLLATVTLATVPMSATVIGFDDLDASLGDIVLSNYQGFSWTDVSVYTTLPGFPGFNNNIVSPTNAAYSSGALTNNTMLGMVTAATPFDFTGASVGSGYYDNLSLTAQGFVAGTLYYSQAITVGTSGPQSLSANFTGIDTLVFSAALTNATTDPYGCGANCLQFTFDNISLTPDPNAPTGPPIQPPPPPPTMPSEVPEPTTLACLSLGLLVLSSRLRPRCRA